MIIVAKMCICDIDTGYNLCATASKPHQNDMPSTSKVMKFIISIAPQKSSANKPCIIV